MEAINSVIKVAPTSRAKSSNPLNNFDKRRILKCFCYVGHQCFRVACDELHQGYMENCQTDEFGSRASKYACANCSINSFANTFPCESGFGFC